jgi:hypothetical protein
MSINASSGATFWKVSALGFGLAGVLSLASVRATWAAEPAPRAGVRALAEGTEKKDEEPKGEPVAVDKLPKAVVDGVKKAMPGARITKASKLKDGNFYLDNVKVGKKGWDVTVDEDGKIVKKEECHDDD